MKHILFISIFFITLFSMKVEIQGDGCAGWADWSNRSGKPSAIFPPGGEYEVLDTYHPWFQVKVLTGKMKGKTGFIWSEMVDELKLTIKHPGVNFRSEPNKTNDNEIGVLFPGDKVKFLKAIPNRYLVKWNKLFAYGTWERVWIHHSRARVMK